jgi:hypothetical protein
MFLASPRAGKGDKKDRGKTVLKNYMSRRNFSKIDKKHPKQQQPEGNNKKPHQR